MISGAAGLHTVQRRDELAPKSESHLVVELIKNLHIRELLG